MAPTERFGNRGAALLLFRGRAAFGNMVAKTDDGAFGNEVARMISLCSIIESNSYLRSPKIKQTFILGTQGLLLFRGRAFSATEYFLRMLSAQSRYRTRHAENKMLFYF